ncbi:MAG: hypothetical protein ACYTHK_17220 [Planctomycetota bacterium]|jgi:hypothetical protein
MRGRTRRRAERGSVLLVAIFLAIVMLGYAATLVMTGFAVSTESRSHIESGRAQEAAASGIYHAAAYLNRIWESKLPEVTTQTTVLRGTPSSTRSLRYSFNIQKGDLDGADNDLDGLIDERDEGPVFEIRSVGSVGNATETIRVTARREPVILPSAVYLEDETPNLTLSGSFKLDGDDMGLSGGHTGVEAPGLGTTGDPTNFIANLPHSVVNKITGVGSSPSVGEVDVFDDVKTIIDRALETNPIVLGAYPDGHYGTVDEPKIVVTSSKFDISGTFHGFGLLIILGSEFNMSGGSLKWNGLVIVHSDANHEFTNGSVNILGGLILAGADFRDDDDEDLGSFNVQYSREAMELGTGPLGLGRIRVFNWRTAARGAPVVP